jgi:hypothetical protein
LGLALLHAVNEFARCLGSWTPEGGPAWWLKAGQPQDVEMHLNSATKMMQQGTSCAAKRAQERCFVNAWLRRESKEGRNWAGLRHIAIIGGLRLEQRFGTVSEPAK